MPGYAQSAYFEDGELIIELYSYGDQKAYEYANLLSFDPAQQQALARSLGATAPVEPADLLAKLKGRFESYQDVLDFTKAENLGCTASVDMNP